MSTDAQPMRLRLRAMLAYAEEARRDAEVRHRTAERLAARALAAQVAAERAHERLVNARLDDDHVTAQVVGDQ